MDYCPPRTLPYRSQYRPRLRPEKGIRRQALGRSRGGLTTKLHLRCNAFGFPVNWIGAACDGGSRSTTGGCRSNLSAKRDPKTRERGHDPIPRKKSLLWVRPPLESRQYAHYSLPHVHRAPHRRPAFPIPARDGCAPRPPARRRGPQRHWQRHQLRRYSAAAGGAANQPEPRRRARPGSTLRAQPGACSAAAAHRSPCPVVCAAPACAFARPPSLPPRAHQPPCISQPGRHALHPGGIPPTQPQPVPFSTPPSRTAIPRPWSCWCPRSSSTSIRSCRPHRASRIPRQRFPTCGTASAPPSTTPRPKRHCPQRSRQCQPLLRMQRRMRRPHRRIRRHR
jgi:hypothetical protein